MNHSFDKSYWDDIWSSDRAGAMSASDPNPHLRRQVEGLNPGSAIDAGCGAGAEAIWLASAGWTVTGVDVAEAALAFAERRATEAGVADRVQWVRADLSTWAPERQYDLVATHYAHPAIPQLEFYRRIATWVAPGGTLLIVGHLHHYGADAEAEGQPPAKASATAASITELLDPEIWQIVVAEESQRTAAGPGAYQTTLHDVVVRATRRS